MIHRTKSNLCMPLMTLLDEMETQKELMMTTNLMEIVQTWTQFSILHRMSIKVVSIDSLVVRCLALTTSFRVYKKAVYTASVANIKIKIMDVHYLMVTTVSNQIRKFDHRDLVDQTMRIWHLVLFNKRKVKMSKFQIHMRVKTFWTTWELLYHLMKMPENHDT